MKWTSKHSFYLGLGIVAALGGFLLYLKLRNYRHDVEDGIETNGTTTTENNMESPAANYDTTKRGYRNNNPLNIRLSNNKWQGEIVPSGDDSFCQFKSMVYGFRAAMVCIRTYITKYHLYTLQEIINRWAPWGDGNNPTNYAKKIMNRWPEDFPNGETVIDYTNCNQMAKLVYAMAIVENGSEPLLVDCINAHHLI